MSLTITIPDPLAERLQARAQARQRSAQEIVVELLDQNLEEDIDAELKALVARIRALPPDPSLIRPATGSLKEYLRESLAREAEAGEAFDEEAWQRDWDAIEAEMKAISRANDLAEGLI